MNSKSSSDYITTRFIFLKFLGIVYFIAFLSLLIQILGLVGENGILPVKNFLQFAQNNFGSECYLFFPTLFWINNSDFSLQLLCILGIVFSILVILGIAQIISFFLLWLLYLSLVIACQDFLGFQWDNLLLEAGFLAVLFAPWKILPKSPETKLPLVVLWLLRWLLFRLMFLSGVVKIMSGDETWGNLTALNFHYETQPLPTVMAFYMHQLPQWFQKFSVCSVYVFELIVPFLIFAPRNFRIFGFIQLVFFQLLIIATGNYCFFNLLTIILCILLLDDRFIRDFFKVGISLRVIPNTKFARFWATFIVLPLSIVIFTVTFMLFSKIIPIRINWPLPLLKLYSFVLPFRSTNNYGLFSVMTTSRPEIIIEGSNDRVKWKPYSFKYKPGKLDEPPCFVQPHQPRLDWQMWFAALGNYQQNPWFLNFCRCLLKGSNEVNKLLKNNPFSNSPPKYLRALLYDYQFTSPSELKHSGKWWKRKVKDFYLPPVTLVEDNLVQF